MLFRSSRLVGAAVAYLALAGCSEPSGAFIVAVSSEASVPVELDRFEIRVSRGEKSFTRSYSAPGEVKIPGTLTVFNDTEGSDEPLTVTVSARKGEGSAWRVSRSARLRFAEDRTKLLRMSLRYACFDRPCPEGQTCSGGECVGVDLDGASLPDSNDPSEALPTRGQHGCFDPGACLRDAVEVEVSASCTFALASGNAAAEWKVAPGKLVVLEPDAVEGYTAGAGVAKLSPGLCEAYRRGDLRRVFTSSACPGKTRSAALCSDAPDASALGGAGGKGGAGGGGQGGGGQGGGGQGGVAGSPAVCGNSEQEPGEACDNSDLGGQTCAVLLDDVTAQGKLWCRQDCTFDTSNCYVCGDGIVNGTEICDGKDLKGETCASVTGDPDSAGELRCFGCQFNTSLCSHCGDGTKGGNEECDGKVFGESCKALAGKYATGSPTCTSGCKLSLDGCEFCGNGKASAVEGCDGDDLGGKTCADLVGAGATGALSCNGCQFDISGCSTPVFTSDAGGLQPGALWPVAWRHPSGWAHSEFPSIAAPKAAWEAPYAVTGSPVVAADGTIYFASGNKLVALDPGGQLKWAFDCNAEAGRSPAINKNGDVFLGSAGGIVYWVKPDGQLKAQGNNTPIKFQKYGDMIAGSNYAVVIGTLAGGNPIVAIFSVAGGDSNMSFSMGGATDFSSPSIAPDGSIWVSMTNGTSSQILIHDGSGLGGGFSEDGPASGPPIFGSNGAFYLNTKSGKLLSGDGSQKAKDTFWSLDGVGASKHLSVASDGTIHVAAEGGDLTAVNPDGTVRWVYKPATKLAGTSVVAGDGTIYAPAGNQIIAVTPEGKEKWIFANNTAAPFSSDLSIGASGMLLVSDGTRLISIQ